MVPSNLDIASIEKKFVAKEDQGGLMRVHGRLEDIRSLPDDMRNPVVLPRNHPVALSTVAPLAPKTVVIAVTRA